jgi:hypothetical protein
VEAASSSGGMFFRATVFFTSDMYGPQASPCFLARRVSRRVWPLALRGVFCVSFARFVHNVCSASLCRAFDSLTLVTLVTFFLPTFPYS